MTTVISQMPESIPAPKKKSEQIKENIAQLRRQIAEMEQESGKLNRQLRTRHTSGVNGRPHVNVDAIEKQLTRLEAGIDNLQAGIKRMESNLPLLIVSENAAEQMDRELAEKERQRAAADRAAHDQAVKVAALEQWLKVPGQSAAGFESAWPTIAQRIAMDKAIEAGSAESEIAHDAPMRLAAINALASRYGRKEVKLQ